MPGRLEVGTSWRSHASAQDSPIKSAPAARRLLLLADFSGRGSRAAHDAPGLRERKPIAVDFETLEAVMQTLSPRVAVAGGTLQVESLDDLHPDRLLVGLPAAVLPEHIQPAQGPAPLQAEDDSATIHRLLGRSPAARVATAGGIDALLRQVVAPHVVAATPPPAPRHRAALATHLRSLLADPGLQAVEAAWRSVEWLLSRLDFDQGLELHLLDCTRQEIAADLVAAGGQPAATGLLHAVTQRRSRQPDEPPWLAMVGLFDFDDSTLDMALLAALGSVARLCAAPFIGGAAPALLQAALHDRTGPGWQTLRDSEVATWIALAGPRLLLRAPYGHGGEAVEALPYDELGDEGDEADSLAHLLWAPASALCALAIGQAVNEGQPEAVNICGLELDGLPAVITAERGVLCAERRLDRDQAAALHAQGLIAVCGERGRHSLRLSALHSIAGPDRPLGR